MYRVSTHVSTLVLFFFGGGDGTEVIVIGTLLYKMVYVYLNRHQS